MSCNQNCNQGRTCNCDMNPFDDKHWKFSRTDPFKHTEFEEDDIGKLNVPVVFVLLTVVLSCILYLF